jgi:trk system potassium uptake protein TrkA
VFFIVVGCGRVGSELAYALYGSGHQVAVIDQVGTSFGHLHPAYRGRTIEGEVLARDVLREAGIEQADGLAAVTNSDSVNAVVAHVARSVFGVARVVARNYDPRWRGLHEAFGVQLVSSTAWGAQRIEELLLTPGLRAVFSAGNGEVEVYELLVPPSCAGRTLGELLPAQDGRAVAHTRAGRAEIPAPEARLQAGDVLHVALHQDGLARLHARIHEER